MSIPTKDQRILFGRAAGRCSICKKLVAIDASNVSQATIIGEMCHIIGEKDKSARCKSKMEQSDRNRYHNLILLCRNHHKIIDDDEKEYPVEVLHQIKSDHEIYVEEALTDSKLQSTFYEDLIRNTVEWLQLTNWDFHSSYLLRYIYYSSLSEGVDKFNIKLQRIVWTNQNKKVEKAFEDLYKHISNFHNEFHLNSQILDRSDINDNYSVFIEDKSYRKNSLTLEERNKFDDISEKWRNNCGELLFNAVVALNCWSDVIRKEIKPDFFISQGKFIINDDTGYTTNQVPSVYTPEQYIKTGVSIKKLKE